MASLDALRAEMRIDNVAYTHSTTLSMNLTRSVAEVLIHNQQFTEKAVGPYSGDFSGGGVVQDDHYALLSSVTAGESHTIHIYPDSSSASNYWTFTGYFTDWSASGPADGFWEIDFSGIIDGQVTITGFGS